jgi:SAM-dependent methyltransferase
MNGNDIEKKKIFANSIHRIRKSKLQPKAVHVAQLSHVKSDTKKKVDIYAASYGNFATKIYAEIRRDAFGEDIGQNSWLTSTEYDRFLSWLSLTPESRVLDVCCGAGGPTLRLAKRYGCNVAGIDSEAKAIVAAKIMAKSLGLSGRTRFEVSDASRSLPFENDSFDLLVCIDAINHLPARNRVFNEWARVVKPGGMVLFTDPVTVTGPLSNDEISVRSSIGYFLFVPLGEDERLLHSAGFKLIKSEDVTENMALLARRRHAAREARGEALREIEGKATYEGSQEFFRVAELLARERRLSRLVYLAEKPANS